jgi:hypothetical protein
MAGGGAVLLELTRTPYTTSPHPPDSSPGRTRLWSLRLVETRTFGTGVVLLRYKTTGALDSADRQERDQG